jgi:uncharacterized RDD family membrane protein YckC
MRGFRDSPATARRYGRPAPLPTTRRSTITHPPERLSYASRRRGVAWTVDACLVIGLVAGGALLASPDDTAAGDWLGTAPGVAVMLALGFLYLGLLTPSRGAHSGQTLGKRLIGVTVTRPDGRPPGRARLLARAACDMGTIAGFLLIVSALDDGEPGQTPGVKGLIIAPFFFAAWAVRDRLLDVQLSHRS